MSKVCSGVWLKLCRSTWPFARGFIFWLTLCSRIPLFTILFHHYSFKIPFFWLSGPLPASTTTSWTRALQIIERWKLSRNYTMSWKSTNCSQSEGLVYWLTTIKWFNVMVSILEIVEWVRNNKLLFITSPFNYCIPLQYLIIPPKSVGVSAAPAWSNVLLVAEARIQIWHTRTMLPFMWVASTCNKTTYSSCRLWMKQHRQRSRCTNRYWESRWNDLYIHNM